MHNFKTSAQHSYIWQWAADANAFQMLKPICLRMIWILYQFFYYNKWNNPFQSNEKYFALLTIKFHTHRRSPTVFHLRKLQWAEQNKKQRENNNLFSCAECHFAINPCLIMDQQNRK